MATPCYVIVGAGVAGASAAEALRGAGFDGSVVLIGNETEPPYQRPPLSKELLRGEASSDFPLLRSAQFYESNAIELHTHERVTRIDTSTGRIECESGTRFAYDKLLIATGGRPRAMQVPGSDLEGVHYLRTLRQSLALHEALEQRPRVLIVGGGFIGCEVAASARQLGCDVVIAGRTLIMEHALGSQLGAIYADYHRNHGVQVNVGVRVVAFRGTDRLEEAVLSDGTKVPCSVAVIGIGIVPSLDIAVALNTDDGIVTDDFCRTTVHNVFAAGDIARSWRPRYGRALRFEHFDNAELQGAAAAHSMVGKPAPYDPIPFFWSDQYEFALQYYGHAAAWDRVVLRGKPNEGSFSAFYLLDGRIEAVCAVNRSGDASTIKRLLSRSDVSVQKLEDDDFPLKQLLSAEAHAR